eukprot:Sspe_Gene.108950::Locus_88199_Transcript_1_1_Confidence_1.000_Length_562::g.108950::m.108950
MGRFAEALRRWEEALPMLKDDYRLYEMRGQVLMECDLHWDAVRSAEEARRLTGGVWAPALLTLGRAQANYGEIAGAAATLQGALEMADGAQQQYPPAERVGALRDEFESDLAWVRGLQEKLEEAGVEDQAMHTLATSRVVAAREAEAAGRRTQTSAS